MARTELEGGPRPAPLDADDIRWLLEHPEAVALVAQPIGDLRRGVVVGYELLSRFTLPQGKPAFPDKVFATAIAAGLGAELETLVVRKALATARTKPVNCFVTINVDPLHVDAPSVTAAILEHGHLGGLVFELTEHNAVSDLTTMRRSLDLLRSRGALVAIDDAGAGYSGLKQIIELKPQFLKLDRDLVSGIDTNETKWVLVQMLGELAGRLDAWVLAEGIETDAELAALHQLGVPLGQGYFLGRPGPQWPELTPASRGWFDAHPPAHGPRRSRRTPLVSSLVAPCATCSGDEPWPEAKIAVRLDRNRRPLAMRLASAGGERLRAELEMLRVKPDTAVVAVATRATTRDERYRWDPLVCIDERGEFQGVVSFERIVGTLATEALIDPTPSTTEEPSPVSPRGDGAPGVRH